MNNKFPKKYFFVFLFIVICCFAFAYLFLRNNPSPPYVQPATMNNESTVDVSLLTKKFDFEKETTGSTEKAFSGNYSFKLKADVEYGFGINKKMKDIPDYQNLRSIELEVKCWMKKKTSAVYVLSIDDSKGKNIFWDGKAIEVDKNEEWCTIKIKYDLKPEYLNEDYSIKIYPWNKAREEFFIDDIEVNYYGKGTANISNNFTPNSNTNFFFDYEKADGLIGTETIKQTTAHSGKMACDFTGGKEYGPLILKKLSEISSTLINKISLSIWVYPLTDNPNMVLTASITDSKKESIFWQGEGTENGNFPKNTWTKINTSFNLPVEKMSPEDIIQVNVWNKGKTDIIADDLEIVYGENEERKGNPSAIDANTIYNKTFVPQKNKPPFKTIWFTKQEINNGNSTFITSDKSNPLADLSPNDEYIVGDFVKDKNNLDEIVCIKNGKSSLFSFSPESKEFKQIEIIPAIDNLIKNNKNEVIDKSHFSNTDIVFKGDYSGNKKEEFLKYNSDWRFDLKLIEKENNDYTILGNIDFKGYANDYNPKYYEFIKIISGRFIDAKKTSILIMMCNCADVKFNGKHCTQFENLNYLPNSTQLYSIE